jgi:enamine deaminase RidA (YjgF/YER057c/UK114 family)
VAFDLLNASHTLRKKRKIKAPLAGIDNGERAMKRIILTLVAATLFEASLAADENFTRTGSVGEAIIASRHDQDMYGQYHFSPAYRAGAFLFFSGVVAEPPGDNPATPEEFQQDLRRAFSAIKRTLAAAGADFDQVVKLRTFHVFDSPHFEGDKAAHIKAFMTVKDEFLPEPYSAWTAIGVDELFPDRGLVEIEIIVHAPGD